VARIVIEEAVLYIMAFYLVCSVIFAVGIFDTFLPGQRYNSTTMSFEAYTKTPSPSIWGNDYELNETLEKYNNTFDKANPGAMLDPTAIVSSVGFYLGFLYDMISSTLLYAVLTPFIGAAWASKITFVLNLMVVIVGIRVITGRIRWD